MYQALAVLREPGSQHILGYADRHHILLPFGIWGNGVSFGSVSCMCVNNVF